MVNLSCHWFYLLMVSAQLVEGVQQQEPVFHTITRQIRLAALRRLVFKIMANAQRCHFTIASYREKGLELPSRALMRTRSEHASYDSCSTCAARADSDQEILVMSGLVRYSKFNEGYTYTPPTRTIFYNIEVIKALGHFKLFECIKIFFNNMDTNFERACMANVKEKY